MLKHSWIFIILFAAVIDSCKDMGSNVPVKPVTPIIAGIRPDSGAVGDTVAITGSSFGSVQGSSSILFAPGITATTILSWSNDTIVVKVPTGAVTGNVSISVNGTTSNGFQFKASTAVVTFVSFQTDVLPILLNNCAVSGCHTGSSPSSGFNASTYEGVRAGGSKYGTSVVIQNDSTNSGIMKMIRSTQNLYGIRMPPSGKYSATGLPDSLIVTIGTWIQQGASNN